jgi:hypothetical protein
MVKAVNLITPNHPLQAGNSSILTSKIGGHPGLPM